jgi:hypothetical protein
VNDFRITRWVALLLGATTWAQADPETPRSPQQPLSALTIWDDGLSEMSYFAATDRIYGVDRRYTRVQLLNRQWMHKETGVKVDPGDPAAVPVFKMNISEEIPTENYNYRYLVSVFLERLSLTPFKLAASSQEWCGTSFKSLRWKDNGLTIRSFSYFDGEGDRTWTVSGDVMPYEALPILARNVAASRKARDLLVLAAARTTHAANDEASPARLVPGSTKTVTVPAGRFDTVKVDLVWEGPETSFDVTTKPPYLLIRYRNGNARGELSLVERRPYWDRSSRSSFYDVNHAP